MLGLLSRRTASAAKAGEHESVDTLSCRFDGTTAEYFEIWIVNVLMTVCSLGLLKPWAKSRKHQYFYSKTSVGKHQLGYWPDNKKLLSQALLIPVLFVASIAAALFSPVLFFAIVAVSALLYPMYRHHSLLEHAAATSYRGRRFSYGGNLKDSYLRLLGWPVLTVGLALLPLGHSLRSSWGYRIEHHSYGDEGFVVKLKLAQLWKLVLATGVAALFAIAVVVAAVHAWLLVQPGGQTIQSLAMSFLEGRWSATHMAATLGLLVMFCVPLAIWRALSEQALYAGTQLEAGVSFDTEISATKLAGLYFVNALAIGLSLGFAIP
ncbi:MAG: DUF898 family protein, partial [Granulosicoccaceae bacterium]